MFRLLIIRCTVNPCSYVKENFAGTLTSGLFCKVINLIQMVSLYFLQLCMYINELMNY